MIGVGSATGRPPGGASSSGVEGGEEPGDSVCKVMSLLDVAGALDLRLLAPVAVFAEEGLPLSLRRLGGIFLEMAGSRGLQGFGEYVNLLGLSRICRGQKNRTF
jgi:hypothetical protein